MRVSPRETTKRKALNLRIKPAAEDKPLDRTAFAVSPEAYREFLARLDAPPRPNKRLLKSMQTAAPWGKCP